MTTFRSRFLLAMGLAGAAGLLTNVNCGSGGGGGTGGHAGAGQTGGKGGNGTAGATATGGVGQAGSGGSAGTTGVAGSGGNAGSTTTGSGNSAGGGGTTGVAGAAGGQGGTAGGAGGSVAFASFVPFTFDKNVQGWSLNNNATVGNLVNLDGGAPPSLGWASGVGSPSAGSVKVEATFTNYNQFVLASVNLQPLVDVTGKTLTAWVMLASVDGGPAFDGAAQLQASATSNYIPASSTSATLTPGVWKQLTVAPKTQNPSFDETQLIQLGVSFNSGSKADGGAFTPVTATFYIDTVTDGSGAPPPPAINHTFDKSIQSYYMDAPNFPVADGGTGPAISFDSAVGDPAPGSLEVTVPFSGYRQFASPEVNIWPPADITGKILHAKVMLMSGTFPSGYAYLHVSAPDFNHYAQGATVGATAFTPGTWVDLTLDPSTITAAGFDPTAVIQVGVQIGTGDQPDGGTFPTTGTDLTFHIDSIVTQ